MHLGLGTGGEKKTGCGGTARLYIGRKGRAVLISAFEGQGGGFGGHGGTSGKTLYEKKEGKRGRKSERRK